MEKIIKRDSMGFISNIINSIKLIKTSTEQKQTNEFIENTDPLFTDKFNAWYENIQGTEAYDNILSKFVKNYSELMYENINDGMIAYLFQTALFKGYACAEYFINAKKYDYNTEIEYTNDFQSGAAMIKLDFLMSNTNDEEFITNNIDDFFYKIIEKDKGSYEHIVVEEQRKEIFDSSKYYMAVGILYRFTELNIRYSDFPEETDASMITKATFPKLYDFLRK